MGPSADGLRAQEESGDGGRRTWILVVRAFQIRECIFLPLKVPNDPFSLVQLLVESRRMCLMVCLLARADLPNRNCAVDKTVRPGTIEIEETNGLVRQQPLVRHKVVERNPD
jgi:hypothetical protein